MEILQRHGYGLLFLIGFAEFAGLPIAAVPVLIASGALASAGGLTLPAVAGMAALFCATVRAPLTGIALTIEMTGNYLMILPLILTCLTSTIVAQGLGGQPIYTVLLKRTLDLAKKIGT